MSEARALLEAARDKMSFLLSVIRSGELLSESEEAEVRSVLDAIRRADRPEARVAVGESRTEVVQRMQREGGGPVTAVMVSHAGEVPEFPTTKNGISMLVNAEWHAPQCKVNRTRQYMDCDCSLSRAIAATEQEAIRRADRPEARVAEGLLAEMVGDYHQTGSIRDHVDPGAAGWDVNKDWRICEDSLCVATRDVLANLPAPRPQEPLCLCGEPRVAGVHEDDDLDLHAYTPRPPEPDRTASPTHPEPCADPDHTSDADRPEARVAEGLTVERCAGYDLSDRPDLAPNIVCTLPAGHTGYHLPAPRPPEPDRTAALVEAARMLEYLWSAENLNGAVVSDYFYDDDPLTEDVPRVIAAARAALAATPDEAP
jgi:hypothetical protein